MLLLNKYIIDIAQFYCNTNKNKKKKFKLSDINIQIRCILTKYQKTN